MPELKMNDKVLYVADDSRQTTQRHLPIPKNTIGHVYWISPDKKHVAVSWSHRHDDNSVHQMNSADLMPVGKETGGHGLPFSAKKEGKMDSEDVDVKAKNVHIDLEPHEHEDTYEALGRAEVERQEGFLASPHSNIGEGDASPWKDSMPGGKADRKEPADFDKAVLKKGTEHEREHTSDSKKAKEIAMDHLTDDPDYYKKLAKVESAWSQLAEALSEAEPKADDDEADDDIMSRLSKGSHFGPTDPTDAGGKSRYKHTDVGSLPIDVQDYDTPTHPHLQKARGDLKQGLDWVLKQVKQAVPDLDKFKGKAKPAGGTPSGLGKTGSAGVPDVMPGPGGHMFPTFSGKDKADPSAKGAKGERDPKTGQPLQAPKAGGADKMSPSDFAKISRVGPAGRSGLTNFPGGPQTKAATPRGDAPKGAGEGGYWELARLAQELENIPSMESDKAMTRLQSVTNDLHRLKKSLKNNPNKDPGLEKAAKGVEAALTGIPALMKSAGALAKSSATDKGLWQRKMSARPGDEPSIPMDKRGGMSKADLDKAASGAFVPKKQIVYPTGQEPEKTKSKADKEKDAEKAKQAAASQRAQPTVRKAADKEPEKKEPTHTKMPATGVGVSKPAGKETEPVKPKADMSRVAPKVRKAADKKDEPEKKDEPKKEPEKKDGDKKESVWLDLARLVG